MKHSAKTQHETNGNRAKKHENILLDILERIFTSLAVFWGALREQMASKKI